MGDKVRKPSVSEVIKIYRGYNYRIGIGPRLYRTPYEIKRDMEEVAERLSEIGDMLNVRNLISEVITEQSEGDASRKATAAVELCEFASEVAEQMRELENTLDELRCELIESLDIVG